MTQQKIVSAALPSQQTESPAPNPRVIKIIFAVCLVLSLLAQIGAARTTTFSFDEILTVQIASLRDPAAIANALNLGADGMPFTFHWLTGQIGGLFSNPHIGYRLPSIVGYVLALVGVFLFVGKRLGYGLGLAASLILTMTPFLTTNQGRPYWLVIGLLALATALWQRSNKLWFGIGFAICLTLATAVHHLAIVGLICFGIAELVAFFVTRKIRWGIWVSLFIAVIPFLLTFSVLQHYKEGFAAHFWSKPGWESIAESYKVVLGVHGAYAGAFALCMVLIGATAFLNQNPAAANEVADYTIPELWLAGMFLLWPVIVVLLAMSQHSGYAERYAAPVLIGFVFAVAWLLRPLATLNLKWLLSALLVVFAMTLTSALPRLVTSKDVANPNAQPIHTAMNKQETGNDDPPFYKVSFPDRSNSSQSELPVVMANADDFLSAAFYAANSTTGKHCYYLANAEAAVQFCGTDTFDKTLLALRRANLVPKRGGEVVDLPEFLANNKRFIVWCSSNPVSSWLPRYLISRGAYLRVLQEADKLKVYLVDAGSLSPKD